MKCNIKSLATCTFVLVWSVLGVAAGCRASESRPGAAETAHAAPSALPALATARIAIVGASVSAGFGGMPFADAFRAGAPRSTIENAANVLLFRDPIGESRLQIEKAIAFQATTIVAIDFLFWNLYGSTDPGWRERALAAGLAELERARATGAWLIVGDVPHVVTAAEWMLPRSQVPDATTLAALNAQIATWARGRERVLLVPFAEWARPLASDAAVEIAPGEQVPARSLMAADGLHANPLGVWYLLDKLDHWIEAQLPGTPRDALRFVRPAPEPR
ncbi:MAG: hypothetical protein M3680_13830 [Myxococcota bacterium]|nr:hypothetical protein [Myxococcota bacterium]